MPAFGSIARDAITRRPDAGVVGVLVDIPVSVLVFSAPANDGVSGATVDIAVSSIDFTAPANAPVGGTMVDIEFTQLVMTSGAAAAAGGASIDTRSTRAAHRGCAIAGCAITRRPDALYTYLAGSQIILQAHRNEIAAGTLIDIPPSGMNLTALSPEIIARTRAIRGIAISS